jgi:hypothetical protein
LLVLGWFGLIDSRFAFALRVLLQLILCCLALASLLVRNWFESGSVLAPVWFAVGSGLVPGWFPVAFLLAHINFAAFCESFRSWFFVALSSRTVGRLVRNWLETCSVLAQGVCKFRSGSVQDWFTVGPLLVRGWLAVAFLLAHTTFAAAKRVLRGWFSIALRKLRSRPLRRWFAAGSRMAQGAGSGLIHGWFRVGSLLVIGWFAVGSLLLSCCVTAISPVFVTACQLILCCSALAARAVGCWFATVSKVVQDGFSAALVRGCFEIGSRLVSCYSPVVPAGSRQLLLRFASVFADDSLLLRLGFTDGRALFSQLVRK